MKKFGLTVASVPEYLKMLERNIVDSDLIVNCKSFLSYLWTGLALNPHVYTFSKASI